MIRPTGWFVLSGSVFGPWLQWASQAGAWRRDLRPTSLIGQVGIAIVAAKPGVLARDVRRVFVLAALVHRHGRPQWRQGGRAPTK